MPQFRCVYYSRYNFCPCFLLCKKAKGIRHLVYSPADLAKSIGILLAASGIGFLFQKLGFAEANIITVYVLGVLLTSAITTHWIYSLISSIVSVLLFNFYLPFRDFHWKHTIRDIQLPLLSCFLRHS